MYVRYGIVRFAAVCHYSPPRARARVCACACACACACVRARARVCVFARARERERERASERERERERERARARVSLLIHTSVDMVFKYSNPNSICNRCMLQKLLAIIWIWSSCPWVIRGTILKDQNFFCMQ